MKIFMPFAAAVLALAAGAQSPLLVQPTGGGFYGWNVPSPNHQTFFNMTVNTTITLQALRTPLYSPVGTSGSVQVWLTNPGITTFVGNETNASNWTMVASGPIVANGTTGGIAALTSTTCQSIAGGGGLVLQPGTRGVAIRYLGVATLYYAVLTAPQTFSNAELTVSGGAIQYTAFVSAPAAPAAIPTGGTYAGWNWYGSIEYANGVVPHACANAATYGTGCYSRYASFYQEFTSAAAASTALNGKSLSLVPNGMGGYDVMQGIPGFGYVAPSPTATQIPATDEGEAQQALTVPIAYPGGTATSLFIHSNGIVSVASNSTVAGPNTPDPFPFLNAPAPGWWSWHNYNPTEAGSGFIWFEELVGPSALTTITWLAVESYPTTAANPSTYQLTIEPFTGIVTFNWVSIDATGNSGVLQFDDTLVGWSPGGPSPDPGPSNLPALFAGGTPLSLPGTEVFPLALVASAKPIIGTTIDLTTSNPSTNPGVGINFVSVGQFPAPGINLGVIGAAGCAAFVDISAGVGNVISNLGMGFPPMSVTFPLPNNPIYAGLSIYSQSVWLDPAANAFGIITSNGLSLLLGNY
ncbi:MAG TPA: hypothetical protein VFZ65_15030 [Planctomycetota bacterium]|nr:hypothetical protein [Planctomycetota bacterium]